MTDSLAGTAPGTNPRGLVAVVLAAGEGRRLRPLTLRRPKPLCPVGNVALLDVALGRVREVTREVAVNVHHGRDQMEHHLAGQPGVHVSVEAERALGTAGALGRLRSWIDGRDVVVLNADTWCDEPVADGLAGWDGERTRVVVAGRAGFGPRAGIVASLLPWPVVAELGEEPTELYETTWKPAAAAGRLDVVGTDARFFDCGTPASYLAANLAATAAAAVDGGSILGEGCRVTGSAEASVLGDGCQVEGTVRRSVLWEHAHVAEGETLQDAIRVSSTMTVLVR
jgi:NDP-sugar pyrophosphorylase family protein